MSHTNTPTTFEFMSFLNEALTVSEIMSATKVNHGGCGIFAHLLYDELIKLGFTPEIKVLYYSPNSDSAERNLVSYINKGINLQHAGADHIMISVGGCYFDSTGIVTVAALKSRRMFTITLEQLQALNDHGKWNPTFDRKQVPVIKGWLDKFFTKWIDGTFIQGELLEQVPDKVRMTDYTIKQLKDSSFEGMMSKMLSGMNSPFGNNR